MHQPPDIKKKSIHYLCALISFSQQYISNIFTQLNYETVLIYIYETQYAEKKDIFRKLSVLNSLINTNQKLHNFLQISISLLEKANSILRT